MVTKTASYWIEKLGLLPHPEGGYYRETYRSAEVTEQNGLPERFTGPRNFSTAIYFLLRSRDRSLFHRIKSDELWHHYAGSPLSLYVLNDQGLTHFRLGPDPDNGESLQVAIPAGSWFGALVDREESYTLSGCTVAPGFDFADFEFADRNALLKTFPAHKRILELLTPNA